MRIVKLTEGIPFKKGTGDTRRVVGPHTGAKNLTLNYAVFKPGEYFELHVHRNSEDVFVVLKGRGIVRCGEEECPIEAGDVVYVAPGELHGTVNTGDEEMVIVSCQAPPDPELYGEEG